MQDGRSLGTPETLLKFPHSIDALPYEVWTQLAQRKLDSLKEFLQLLESRVPDAVGPSAPAPIMQQRTSSNEQRQLARGALQDQPQTLRQRSRCCPVLGCPKPIRFESHFKSYFGNVKAFNLKKIKIITEPVAAMAGGGLRLGGDGRRIP